MSEHALVHSLPYDVVLLPIEKVAEHAIDASQKLDKLGGLYTLDGVKFYPHISIYMLQLKVENLPKVSKLLNNLSNKTAAFNLQATGYDSTERFVDIGYEKTNQLISTQNNVIELLNPIRDGIREREAERLKTATGLDKSNILEYGYRSVGDLFRPHLSLSRLKKEHSQFFDVLHPAHTFNGTFDRIGIFEMGDNGTCIRQIDAFDLVTS